MRKIKYEVPDLKQIEVNGHVFDIQKADIDIMEKAVELKNEYSVLAQEGNKVAPEQVIAAVRSVVSYIDDVLGVGAVKKITDGKPIGLISSIELMTLICEAVIEEYNQSVDAKYE